MEQLLRLQHSIKLIDKPIIIPTGKISDKPNAGKEVRTMLHRWKNAFEAGSSTQEFISSIQNQSFAFAFIRRSGMEN